MVFFDSRMAITRIDKGHGFAGDRGVIHQWLSGAPYLLIGSIGESGTLIESRGDGGDVRMHAVLGPQGCYARILIVCDLSEMINVGGEPLFRLFGGGFGDGGQLEEVADNNDLFSGQAQSGKQGGWARH